MLKQHLAALRCNETDLEPDFSVSISSSVITMLPSRLTSHLSRSEILLNIHTEVRLPLEELPLKGVSISYFSSSSRREITAYLQCDDESLLISSPLGLQEE